MADFRAITAVTEGVLQLLRSSHQSENFNQELEFKTYTARDFANPISAGVSLFLYRVVPCGVLRNPPGPKRFDGSDSRSMLPLHLHFMLTVWGGEASLQHSIAGWMMRVIEDSPIFSASLLNAVIPSCFNDNETVEICLAELSNEDLLRMWETLVQNTYQLTVPYVARVVRLESSQSTPASGGIVQTRSLQAAVLNSSNPGER